MKKKNTADGFFAKVYEVAARIPRGSVITYGQIALLIGSPRASRAVGYAMRAAPETLPCHRVVNRRGELSPDEVFGGKDVQRRILESEGVTFFEDGRVNFKKHLWRNI